MTETTLKHLEAQWAAEDQAHQARIEKFAHMGREQALEAIDQVGSYLDLQDARDNYADNLGDTLAEQEPNATRDEIAIAFNAFNLIFEDVPPHKQEGSQAEFDRYIAGDR